VNNCI